MISRYIYICLFSPDIHVYAFELIKIKECISIAMMIQEINVKSDIMI